MLFFGLCFTRILLFFLDFLVKVKILLVFDKHYYRATGTSVGMLYDLTGISFLLCFSFQSWSNSCSSDLFSFRSLSSNLIILIHMTYFSTMSLCNYGFYGLSLLLSVS